MKKVSRRRKNITSAGHLAFKALNSDRKCMMTKRHNGDKQMCRTFFSVNGVEKVGARDATLREADGEMKKKNR